MKNIKLEKIRKKLDILDQNILKNIKKRFILVNKVLKEKKFKNQIVDQKRINYILKNIKKKSSIMNIDQKVTHKIWKAMIYAFIEYERKNFKR